SQGCSLGIAEDLARMVQSATTLGIDSIDNVLDGFADWSNPSSPQLLSADRLIGRGAPLYAALPAAVDLACAAAVGGGTALIRIASADPSAMPGAGALIAARRGMLCVVTDRQSGELWLAGPASGGPWLLRMLGPASISPASCPIGGEVAH